MPEGHKTHFWAREHAEMFAGRRVKVSSPQGRFSDDARLIDGKKLHEIEAVGKQLFYHFSGDSILQIHMGRYGSFKVHPTPPPDPVGNVRMRMVGTKHAIDLSGPTTCRVIDAATKSSIVERLGPDPLAGGKATDVWKLVSESSKPIGAILLDQQVIAGVGNIFRAELLFEQQLSPLIPGKELTRQQFDRLWKSLCKMMRTGLKYGKIITVSSKEAGKPLGELNNKERFRIYGNQSCPRCNSRIEKIKVASRDLYVCAKCQNI